MTFLCICVFVVSHTLASAQAANEADALAAIKRATNPTTKLAAAEDFIAKFPKSNARLIVAELVAPELLKVKNASVALKLLERAKAIFISDEERDILNPVALEAYIIGNRPDDAFALASNMLAKRADDINVLAKMTQAGAEETRKKNQKFNDLSLQYGLKAIAMIEADNKPLLIDEETWAWHKANLSNLYQQTAVLYLPAGKTQEAKAHLMKASALSPLDPINFALMGRIINSEYISQKNAYEAMLEGKAKEDALRKLDPLLDSIIEAYARAVGLAAGYPQYQTLIQQVVPDLTTYYKYRHNKSTKGLPELINRYRMRL